MTSARSERAPWVRPRRAPVVVALAGSLAVTFAACTGDDDAAPPTSTTPETTTTVVDRPADGVLTLGAYLPTTGPGAPLGGPMIEAVEAAVEHINTHGGVLGEPVRLSIVDEGSDMGMDEMLDSDVDAIIGPASSIVALSQLGSTVQPGTGVVSCSPSATALALDAYPDNGFFFRTAPSDSLQMVAIAREAERTGVNSIAVGYLDDPYGRGMRDALVAELAARNRLEVLPSAGFSSDQEDLSETAARLLENEPGVVVVLGDADDGSRLLAALDEATASPPLVIVNDSLRVARQTIEALSPALRNRLTAIAPQASSTAEGGPDGAFAAHAADCVNLVALAAVQAGSDAPSEFRRNIQAVSVGGIGCATFEDCAERIEQNLRIDYQGLSGSVELSNTSGDPVRAWFEAIRFDADGAELDARRFEVF